MNEVFLLSAVRTPIGGFGGSLASLRPAQLAEKVMRAAIERGGVSAQAIENTVLGMVVASQPKDVYASRMAAVAAGIPIAAPAMNVNRLCGSGLQAIVSAAQGIALGEQAIAMACGAESMSNAPFLSLSARFGQKLGDQALLDALMGALQDPFEGMHMGVTAENVAARCGITREMQDEAAAQSHRRALHAITQGYFKEQIVPVEIATRKGSLVFDTDEHPRADTTVESLAALRPAFQKDGTVTAGNSSGINDGAAAMVLASGDAVAAQGLQPMARLVAWGHAGVEPELMGLGPVKAVPVALARAGLRLADMDVIESNEAFAAQACGVAKELGLDPAKTNPNGSGVALGHPIGATGAILTVKAVHELKRIGGRYALVTMCIGGGQGIAMVLERVD